MERLMTVAEVAQYVGCCERTIYRKVQSGDIPCYRMGTLIKFKREEVEQAMKGGNNAKKRNTECRSNPA